MRKPTVTTLMLLQEIESLKRRIAELESRPPVVIHNHPPAEPRVYGPSPFVQNPAYPPGWPFVTGLTIAASQNGGGSGCITANGGGSGG